MKKLLSMIIAFTLAFSFAACGSKNNVPGSTPEAGSQAAVEENTVTDGTTLACYGFMVIKDNTLILDEVEIIEADDKERIAELGLTEANDYPSGYCIYPLNKGSVEYELTDDTVYNFVDFQLLFVDDESGDRQYSTTSKDEFIEYLTTTYSDSPPAQKVPFLVQIQDGKVISVTEEVRFTI